MQNSAFWRSQFSEKMRQTKGSVLPPFFSQLAVSLSRSLWEGTVSPLLQSSSYALSICLGQRQRLHDSWIPPWETLLPTGPQGCPELAAHHTSNGTCWGHFSATSEDWDVCGRINQQSSENWRSEAGMQRTHLRIELQRRWEPEMRHLGNLGHGASITLSPACLEYVISYSACHFTAVTFSSCSFQKKTGLAPKEDLPQSSPECPPLAGLSLPAVRLLVLMNWSHNKVRTTQGQFSTGFLSTVLIPLAFTGALNQKHTSNG